MTTKLRAAGSEPSPAFIAQMRGLLASFGLTPVDRARLDPSPLPLDPEIEEFFR
jgi:hypothetical protein